MSTPAKTNSVPTQSSGQITVVCCYCHQIIGVKQGQAMTGISHGICYSCYGPTSMEWKKQVQQLHNRIPKVTQILP